MAKLITHRYADALFEIGQELGCLDNLFEDAILLKDVFQNNQEFSKTITNPKINTLDKINILKNIFDGKISDNFIGFFNVIFSKNREKEISDILTIFIKKVEDFRGVIFIEIMYAKILSPERLNKIVDMISQNTNKQVRVETKPDQSLIGGLCIKIDGKILDYTIKKQMNDMKNHLMQISC